MTEMRPRIGSRLKGRLVSTMSDVSTAGGQLTGGILARSRHGGLDGVRRRRVRSRSDRILAGRPHVDVGAYAETWLVGLRRGHVWMGGDGKLSSIRPGTLFIAALLAAPKAAVVAGVGVSTGTVKAWRAGGVLELPNSRGHSEMVMPRRARRLGRRD